MSGILKQSKNALLLYAYSNNTEKFKDIDGQNKEELMPGTRLSGTNSPEKVKELLLRNRKYYQDIRENISERAERQFRGSLGKKHRALEEQMMKETKKEKLSEEDLELIWSIIERETWMHMPIVESEKFNLTIAATCSKKGVEKHSDLAISLFQKGDDFRRKNALFELEMRENGLIDSTITRNLLTTSTSNQGYMFLPKSEDVDSIAEFKKAYPGQEVFLDEEALVRILSKEDLQSTETQEKLKEILNQSVIRAN